MWANTRLKEARNTENTIRVEGSTSRQAQSYSHNTDTKKDGDVADDRENTQKFQRPQKRQRYHEREKGEDIDPSVLANLQREEKYTNSEYLFQIKKPRQERIKRSTTKKKEKKKKKGETHMVKGRASYLSIMDESRDIICDEDQVSTAKPELGYWHEDVHEIRASAT